MGGRKVIEMDGIIIIDVPLAVTMVGFFFISFAYRWGLLQFFRDDFAWDLASVVGIASIVACTYAFVWIPRQALGYDPIPDLVQIPYDLALVFLAALPGMTAHRIQLRAYQSDKRTELEAELMEIKAMAQQALEDRKDMKAALQEILQLLQLRSEAIEMIRSREVQKN